MKYAIAVVLLAVVGCALPPAGSSYSEIGAAMGFEADTIQRDHDRVVAVWRHRISGKDYCTAYFDADQWDAYWLSAPTVAVKAGEQAVVDQQTGRVVVIRRGADGNDVLRVDAAREPRALKVE